MTGPEKLYDRLTGDERVRLWLAARSRGDETEAKRLSDACPTYSYTVRDWAWRERIDVAFDVTMIFLCELSALRRLLSQALLWQATTAIMVDRMVDVAIRFFVDGERGDDVTKAWDLDAIVAGFPGSRGEQYMELMESRVSELASAVVSTVTAFDAFSRERFGVSAMAMARAVYPSCQTGWLDYDEDRDGTLAGPFDERRMGQLVSQAEPDAELVALWREGFEALWSKVDG